MHFRLKSSFVKVASVFPLSLEGIPPFKGGLTPKAAFGRQFSILAHWFADFRKVLK